MTNICYREKMRRNPRLGINSGAPETKRANGAPLARDFGKPIKRRKFQESHGELRFTQLALIFFFLLYCGIGSIFQHHEAVSEFANNQPSKIILSIESFLLSHGYILSIPISLVTLLVCRIMV